MKYLLPIGLVSAAIVGIGTSGAVAAPLSPPTASISAESQVQKVRDRYHRRHYHRRHYHGPRAYYGPRYYGGYYRPYYGYYDPPYVYGGIGLPFISLGFGPRYHHHHRRHRHW
jgi:hypothetical protein